MAANPTKSSCNADGAVATQANGGWVVGKIVNDDESGAQAGTTSDSGGGQANDGLVGVKMSLSNQ